ncbi:MAG: YggS family pyridoxal phosphate-dependent enzyme [Acidimicrobiia bacterium]|nr:YggS family pyridoxal phosphate-dependent enzyme [Acidimicrobiia bacterium]
MSSVAERIAEVRGRIASAAARVGRAPSEVTLVAVTKTVGVPAIGEAIAAGQAHLGENRAQELLGKAAILGASAAGTGTGPVWHFIGRLQRNKVKMLAPHVAWWHSIDRPELAGLLARHAPGVSVYVEVNLGDEPQKGGCDPGAAARLVGVLTDAGIGVEGLMTIPPEGEESRPYFGRLRDLADRLGLRGLSMGMTTDFETAVEEGATVVRVGSAIFGPRRTGADLRR